MTGQDEPDLEPLDDEWLAAPPVTFEAGGPSSRSGSREAGSGGGKARRGSGHSSRQARRRRRNALIAGSLAVVALLAVVGAVLAFTRYLPALDDAKTLKSDVTGIVKRLTGAGLDLDRPTLDSVRTDLAAAATRLDHLDGLLRSDPLVGLARILPPTHDLVTGADGVAAAGDALLDAAGAGLSLGDRYVAIREAAAAAGGSSAGSGSSTGGASALAQLVELMATSGSDADRVLADLRTAQAALATVPAKVPSVIGDARTEIQARLDQYLPALEAYTAADGILPGILGWDRPMRYLVLTQNPAELRPTGGYIGSFGLITFDRGRITERSFHDVFELDLKNDYPFVAPPRELGGYLLGDKQSWQLADANWSPDFPTAAQDALRLYTNESGDSRIDGVLAITTQTIDELLMVTGPVTVGGDWNVTIAPGETTLKILQNTRVGTSGKDRKAILGAFADQLFARLLSLPPRQWAKLAGSAETIRAERLLQAWFKDPDAQRLVGEAGWSGAVEAPAGEDAAYAVDANVSPVSKLNLVTSRATDLDVAVDQLGNATVTMGLTWLNNVDTAEGKPLRDLTVGVGSKSDLGLIVRVVLPEFARFEKVSGGSYTPATTLAFERVEGGRRVFGNYLRVPPGKTTLTYRWTSPYAAQILTDDNGDPTTGEYRILLQKQPGLRGGPLSVTFRAPEGMEVTDASAGMEVTGGTARVTIPAFTQDVEIGFRFAVP